MVKAKVIFGDSSNMEELPDRSVHLVVTSPPYFNAPFHYAGTYSSYAEYLSVIRNVACEIYRVLQDGRVACVVVDDVRVGGNLYPIVADVTRTFLDVGFAYRDKIIWVKPEGYIRISRRSGVLLQHPYPLYFYPDNIVETILIFSKGKCNYKSVFTSQQREESRININEYLEKKWYLNVWQITNVLPHPTRVEKGIAAFPLELARRLILLYSYKNEVVLDPFLGSGTTMLAAMLLGRNCVGYEINTALQPIICEKLRDFSFSIDMVYRDDAVSIPLIHREGDKK